MSIINRIADRMLNILVLLLCIVSFLSVEARHRNNSQSVEELYSLKKYLEPSMIDTEMMDCLRKQNPRYLKIRPYKAGIIIETPKDICGNIERIKIEMKNSIINDIDLTRHNSYTRILRLNTENE